MVDSAAGRAATPNGGAAGSVAVLVAGLDLGGTGSRVVVRAGGEVVGQLTLPTAELGAGSVDERVGRVAAAVRGVMPPGHRLVGVGIGASGPITPDWKVITNPDTLPWFSGLPLTELLAAELDVPVRLESDAVAAALGEYHFGAGRGARQLLAVTIGTGIGVSLLRDGVPFRTANGQHPDAGHLPVFGDDNVCYCGLRGCLEQHVSRLGLETRLAEAGLAFAPGGIDELPESPALSAALEAYGRDLGRGLEALEVVYGPDQIVVCGASSRSFHRFQSAVATGMARAPGFRSGVPIVPCELGDFAGALGATTLVDVPHERPAQAPLQDRPA